MLTNPEKIVFESTDDIVDYVSKGIIPTRKNFEKIIIKVASPDAYGSTKVDRESVHIPEHLFINCDKETMRQAVARVYENRVRNRKITLGILGTIALGLLIGGINSGKKNDDDEDDEDDI